MRAWLCGLVPVFFVLVSRGTAVLSLREWAYWLGHETQTMHRGSAVTPNRALSNFHCNPTKGATPSTKTWGPLAWQRESVLWCGIPWRVTEGIFRTVSWMAWVVNEESWRGKKEKSFMALCDAGIKRQNLCLLWKQWLDCSVSSGA